MNHKLRKLAMIAIASSLAAVSTTQADGFKSTAYMSLIGGTQADNARLTIRRAADFGSDIYLIVYIDGTHVATIGPNEGYEAIVRPGRHVLSVRTTPNPYGSTVSHSSDVTMKAAQTYAFTAVWGEPDRAALEGSASGVVRLIRNISHS